MYSTGYNKLNFIMYTKSYMYIIVLSTMKSLWQIHGWTSKLLGKDTFLYQFTSFLTHLADTAHWLT